ncbi:MAG: UBP-type zinc finger domain-containing protein [Polyangiaceae bacterium]
MAHHVDDSIDLSNPCDHVTAETPRKVARPPKGCEECLKIGSSWVHLRICLTCMTVHCCDDSPNKHATKHFHATQHPIITSGEIGETWAYCYADDQFLSQG